MERSISVSDPSVLRHAPFVPREYKRSKTLTSVDWKLLLAFNPPPGYRPRGDSRNQSVTGSDVIDDGEDKVLVILRNILRGLENEIRDDKQRLKDERRLKRDDRRRRRQETLDNNEMSQYGHRRVFRTASPRPFFPASTDNTRKLGNQRSQDLSTTSDDLSYVGVGSLSRIEEVPGLKRTGSSLGRDWSRHSHEPLDDFEPATSIKSEVDTVSTTETLTDHDLSVDVSETSFESRSRSTTPISGISRAKTSYVNDDVVHRHIRNNYVRTMDARKKRLMFRKQMNTMDILPNLKRAEAPSNRNQSPNKYDQDVPFSVKTFINTPTHDDWTASSPETTITQRHLNRSTDTDERERAMNTNRDIKKRRADTKQFDIQAERNTYKEFTKSTKDKTHTDPSGDLQLVPTDNGASTAETNNVKKPVPPKKPVRNKLRNNSSETSLEGTPTKLVSQSDLWRKRPDVIPVPERSSRPVFTIGHRARISRHDDGSRPDTERSHSGTSGYSTDDYSYQTSDSEEEETGYDDVTVHNYREQLNKYFMVLRDGEKMAVMLDEIQVPAQEAITRKSLSLSHSLSMSDLAIPDHVGWITHQSEQRKMWGVVVDMLFCIFDNQENDKPEEVILLPGCNIRPLVYKTAINGLHTRKPAKTITGIAKYQIVIDNASTRKKHLFGLESSAELDTWYSVLKRASTLDPESTNELTSSTRHDSISTTDDVGSGELGISRYKPTRNSMNRAQKLSKSPLSSPRSESPKPLQNGDRCNSPSFYKQNGNQSSPRGQPVVRHDSRRHSIQDIKKHLRRESEQEVSKNQPVKAHHFVHQVSEPVKQLPEKKLRSFGSFESLLKFKKKRKKKHSVSEDSNDDTGSVISSSSIEQEMTSQSMDISASASKLKKSKRLSRSLELNDPKKESNGIVRRASDIKDKVFPKRAQKKRATLGDLADVTIHGFLYHKYHLKWHKLWCVVCRGCFYGFKSQSPSENAHVSVVLANCAVVYVMRKDKREKHLYVFKLSQENKKSIYLCSSDYRELQQWLTVLQMESNSVIVNADELRPFGDSESESMGSSMSSPNGSVTNMQTNVTHNSNTDLQDTGEGSRSRTKKKKQAPPKPPRHSSCPPAVSRDTVSIQTGSDTSTTEDNGRTGSISSQSERSSMSGSQDDIPQHDKALVHVWQNERGYLFNVIRAKLTAYRARKSSGDIYNREVNGYNNEGLLVIQDASKHKGSRHVRRSRSFTTHPDMSSDTEPRSSGDPTDSPTGNLRQRHKPLVVKKIPAKDLESNQTTAGYMEKKGMNAQWMRYWFVLHEGTLFCYLNTDDHLTVDVLNLHGYTVTSLVDQFRGKRFVLQLSHEHFTSTHLSLDSRDEMDEWYEFLQQATGMTSSSYKETTEEDDEQGACAGCEENRNGDVGERRKQVKQKLLEEMLRQKHELEKKQAERHKKQRFRGKENPDPSSHTGDFMTEDQRTSDVTRLRQRRLSTQLKVDTIQKQMDKPNQNRKGLFSFGKTKKVDENKNMFLQDQLKELNTKLNKIDTDLSHVELQDTVFESFDVNQNTKQMSLNTSGELTLERINEHDGGVNNKRPSSVKNTMNKWTNKNFSPMKKKQTSTEKLTLNGSVSNSSLKQNGGYDVIDGNGNGLPEFGNDSDSNPEDVLSNSVTDLTRPTSDLRLDLNPAYSSVPSGLDASPTSLRYTRSNSRSSTVSSLSSPRREINPSVLAEIDAFEELTRQVLGARSKEQVAK